MSRKSKAEEFVNEGYNVTVTGRNVLITDAMKNYAIEKISKIERFSTRIIDVLVTMDIQRAEHRVDIVIKVNDIKIKSQAISDNMYASIDKASDRIVEQLLKYKDRLLDHQKRGIKSTEFNVNIIGTKDELKEMNEDIERENERHLYEKYHPHRVVKNEKRNLKTLTHDEAIMKMELSGDTFLPYRSEEDLKLKVIYRRKDDNFAIMEIEV